MRCSIDLAVRNEWTNVERVRCAVEACVLAASGDADLAAAVALIAGELGENAVKYGDWSGGAPVFDVRVRAEEGKLRVVVESPVPPGRPPEELIDTLCWLGRFPSAKEAYQARLREIEAAPRPGTSRLGLARVAYEGRCALRAEVDGGTVRVIADVAG